MLYFAQSVAIEYSIHGLAGEIIKNKMEGQMCWIVSIDIIVYCRSANKERVNFLLLIYSHCWTEILADNTILVYSAVSIMFCPMFSLNWYETRVGMTGISVVLSSDPCIIAKLFCRVLESRWWIGKYRLFSSVFRPIKEERKEGRKEGMQINAST